MKWDSILLPLMKYFRKRRFKYFVNAYPDLSQLTVLDVGGRPFIWELIKNEYGISPARVVLLNNRQEPNQFEGYEFMIGDGRKLHFTDNSFDLVFSNSVIEHVGSKDDMLDFAKECMRVGKEVYIQTPNKWFPVEPHIVSIFIHWLPRPIYKKCSFMSVRWFYLYKNTKLFYSQFDNINLLARKEFMGLFPNKLIWTEKIFGMAKSFVAMDRKIPDSKRLK